MGYEAKYKYFYNITNNFDAYFHSLVPLQFTNSNNLGEVRMYS